MYLDYVWNEAFYFLSSIYYFDNWREICFCDINRSVFLITPVVVGNTLLLKDSLHRAAVFLFHYGYCFLSPYRTAILQSLCIELLACTASGFSVSTLRFFVFFGFFPGEYPYVIFLDRRKCLPFESIGNAFIFSFKWKW